MAPWWARAGDVWTEGITTCASRTEHWPQAAAVRPTRIKQPPAFTIIIISYGLVRRTNGRVMHIAWPPSSHHPWSSLV